MSIIGEVEAVLEPPARLLISEDVTEIGEVGLTIELNW